MLRIGTAGWAIPRQLAADLAGEGSQLQRYGRQFDAAEINSSFHRPHRRTTYERWAASVPPHFRFAVKLPKTVTHVRRLIDCGEPLAAFADEIGGLGSRRGPLLIQLPPSLSFDAAVASTLFLQASRLLGGAMVCEPRHPSWFDQQADTLLRDHGVARAAADPAIVPAAARPGGCRDLTYFRLHGSPVMYRSSYDEDVIGRLAAELRRLEQSGVACWTMFDNTASGAALADALRLQHRVDGS